MKKLFKTVLSLSLCLVLLAGCSNSTKNDKKETNSKSETSKSTETSIAESKAEIKDENFDFRNSNWGDPLEMVKNSEELLPTDADEQNLMYSSVKVGGMKADVLYTFDNSDKLYRGFYTFTDAHSSDNLYIDDYDKLVKALTEKYGDPKWNKCIWKDDYYKNDKNNWGMAISMGDLVYGALWETETTKITLNLFGDNFKINLSCTYTDINYKEDNSPNTDGL